MANVKNIALELINKGYAVVPVAQLESVTSELNSKYHMHPLGGALVDGASAKVIYIY